MIPGKVFDKAVSAVLKAHLLSYRMMMDFFSKHAMLTRIRIWVNDHFTAAGTASCNRPTTVETDLMKQGLRQPSLSTASSATLSTDSTGLRKIDVFARNQCGTCEGGLSGARKARRGTSCSGWSE